VRLWAGLAALGAAGAGAFAYGALIERRWYTLRRVTVPALGAHSGPLRILHVSDLHLLPGQEDKARFVLSCRELDFDLVVATGDHLGHPEAVTPAVRLLGALGEGRPAVAVLGSNDFFAPVVRNPLRYFLGPSGIGGGQRLDTDALVAGLRDAGWLVLENDRQTVDTPAGQIDVAALGDPHIARDRPREVDWDGGAVDAVLRLGVVHAPYLRALRAFDGAAFDLVVAGHTHGGQVRAPLVGALVDNCDLPLGQARGLSRHRSLWLHVSAGLGTSRYAPFRFLCRPEATLIDVVARQDPENVT
jgi:uncharacterized protein